MGANAQTSVPTFTAGEILTAANMNISARTGIPVFADSTARDAAFGGTGEKTLAEGQYAYLESTNATQVYDGASWVAVGTPPALIFITSGTVTLGSSLSFDNCFSATYANYYIYLVHTAGNNPNMRLRASGSDISLSNYDENTPNYQTGAAGGSTNNSATSWTVSNGAGYSAPEIFLGNPFASTKTAITALFNRTDASIWQMMGGRYNATTSADGFSILGTSITVTARVYGIANS